MNEDKTPEETEQEQFKKLVEAADQRKQPNPCPHCGYCPTCGRPRNPYWTTFNWTS